MESLQSVRPQEAEQQVHCSVTILVYMNVFGSSKEVSSTSSPAHWVTSPESMLSEAMTPHR